MRLLRVCGPEESTGAVVSQYVSRKVTMVLSASPLLAVLTVELFERDLRDPETSPEFWKAWHKRAEKIINQRYHFCLTANDKHSETTFMDMRAWTAARGNEAIAHGNSAAPSPRTPRLPSTDSSGGGTPEPEPQQGAFGATALLSMVQQMSTGSWEALNKTWETIVTFEYRLTDYGLKGTPRFVGASRFTIGSFTSSWNLFWNAGVDGRGACAGRPVEGAGQTEMYFAVSVPEFPQQQSDYLMHEFWMIRLPQSQAAREAGEEERFEIQSLFSWDQDRVGRTRIAGQLSSAAEEPKKYQMLLTVQPKTHDTFLEELFTCDSTRHSLFFKFPIAVGQVTAADGMPVE